MAKYPVEEVSGSHPGCVILKTLKIVPTAALFGAEHISHYLLTLGSLGHGLRSQLDWLPLDVRAQRPPSGYLALGPGPHLYAVYSLTSLLLHLCNIWQTSCGYIII